MVRRTHVLDQKTIGHNRAARAESTEECRMSDPSGIWKKDTQDTGEIRCEWDAQNNQRVI